MAGKSRQVELAPSQVVEKLNHLEYVVNDTKRAVAFLKGGSLKDQTEDFFKLMEIVEDAIGVYRDEVSDLADIK